MRWTIEPDGDDLMLTQGRRVRLHGATEAQVAQYLKDHMIPCDQVTRVDEDGYRTRATSGRRRHWRG